MKVLQVSFTDGPGGAGRAARRLHDGLNQADIQSRMLVARGTHPGQNMHLDRTLAARARRWTGNAIAGMLVRLQQSSNPTLHSINFLPSGLHRRINTLGVDLVNLHAINGEFISIQETARINVPIVWTLHDMWPFCGTEHYDSMDHPGRFRAGYTNANTPHARGAIDLDRWNWGRKTRLWKDSRFHLVAPSNWLAEQAQQSVLFAHHPLRVIHNGLDLQSYAPHDRRKARIQLGLPVDRNLVLFGAMKAVDDVRKGYHLLQAALPDLAAHTEPGAVHLVVFGTDRATNGRESGLPVHALGTVTREDELAAVYAAADVFVAPSIQDNLPNTVVESLACGTPVVAFRTGGMSDMVRHQVNGYLADRDDPHDLAAGIQWVLDDRTRRAELARQARTTAEARFGITRMVAAYTELYAQILDGRDRRAPLNSTDA